MWLFPGLLQEFPLKLVPWLQWSAHLEFSFQATEKIMSLPCLKPLSDFFLSFGYCLNLFTYWIKSCSFGPCLLLQDSTHWPPLLAQCASLSWTSLQFFSCATLLWALSSDRLFIWNILTVNAKMKVYEMQEAWKPKEMIILRPTPFLF